MGKDRGTIARALPYGQYGILLHIRVCREECHAAMLRLHNEQPVKGVAVQFRQCHELLAMGLFNR